MKEDVKYVAVLLAFIAGAFAISCCAVYSFWIGAFVFHSVTAIRIGHSLEMVILFPARTFLRLSGGIMDQMTLLTNPLMYAGINAALLGILGYACCRHWIFRPPTGGNGGG